MKDQKAYEDFKNRVKERFPLLGILHEALIKEDVEMFEDRAFQMILQKTTNSFGLLSDAEANKADEEDFAQPLIDAYALGKFLEEWGEKFSNKPTNINILEHIASRAISR